MKKIAGRIRHSRGPPALVESPYGSISLITLTDFWKLTGCEECVELLLDAGAHINHVNTDGETALIRAADKCEFSE